MNEENKGASKNKWSRIFRKKWFFPAVYLTIAALLLTVVVWYQNLDNQIPDAQEGSEDYVPNLHDEDAESVMEQQEVVKTPVADQEQAEIVTKFYDYNAEEEDQENALVLYNNRYYQSTGIDIAHANDESFDVMASLSGTVTEVKEDPLLGNVVSLSHENGVTTYYASLGEVTVKAGEKVKQGDQLGTAGKNLFGKDKGIHVHFQLRKDDKGVNPESFFNQPVSKLDSLGTEETEESTNPSEDSDATEETETETEESEKEDPSKTEEKPNEEEDVDADKKEDQDENSDEKNEKPNEKMDETSDTSESA